MTSYTSMYIRNQKGIKMRMVTIVGFYGKENEIISQHLLCVGLCFILINNYHCMCCHYRSMLHQIFISHVDNYYICQNMKTIFDDDNIYQSLGVTRKKVRNFSLYMSFTLQCNSSNNILKRIMSCNAFTPTQATQQMDT